MQLRNMLLAAALLVTQSAIGANATTCSTVRINGDHPLLPDCAGGACAFYVVNGYPPVSDLGFGGPEPDAIDFEFYKFDGEPELGTFDLASAINANYALCEQCVMILQDVVDGVPTKRFFQTRGTLKVDGPAPPGIAPDLSLIWSNLNLVEVTIDQFTFESTPVPGGACYDVLPEVVHANGFEGPEYVPAHCAAVANTLDIYWEEVDSYIPACVGIEHTDGSLVDAADGSFSMNGVSVTDACLLPSKYAFTLSADGKTLSGSDTLFNVPMTLTRSDDGACFVGHWIFGDLNFVATIWNFAQ